MTFDHDERDTLMTLDEPAFVAAWRRIVGQPPALILDREEMVAILERERRRAPGGTPSDRGGRD